MTGDGTLAAAQTTGGFTDHEMIDAVGLISMKVSRAHEAVDK